MLSLLHIENIAVVEKADIEFGRGLNVLTGETGAGKSIIIDAIGAVLGGRTSRELVRTGSKNAAVTAVFTDINVSAWCEENGVPHEDELFLMRKITLEGKNICRINGVPVSVSQLRELGSFLLDIHGQHDGQLLLNEQYHLDYLDNFGEESGELARYQDLYDAYRAVKKEYDSLQMDEGEKARRIDTLKFQIGELEQANLQPGEEERLGVRLTLLNNAGKLSDAVNGAFSALYGTENKDGAIDLISEAENNMIYALELSDTFKELAESATDVRYTAEDIAEQLRDIKNSLDFSPNELDEIQTRLALIRRLGRKYGGSEAEMLQYLESCKRELDDIEYASERVEKLDRRLKEAKASALEAGEKLTVSRKKRGRELEARIIAELEHLNMKGVRFSVNIEKKEKGFDKAGLDQVSFLMSANAGEKLGKISKIASGGELARIMLAMKNVLAEGEQIGTMVFDEIDTGVSGVAAQRVGEKLSDLAAVKQVLCVTHLPQIAAVADIHFSISKTVRTGRTYTEITPLDHEGRKWELARLTGGEHITRLSLESAEEQMAAAKAYKN